MNVERTESARRVLTIGGLAALFLGSFLLFLFVTFPYEVLKEALAAEIAQASGYSVQIGEMSANIPLGMTAENVRIEAPGGGPPLTLKSLSVDLGVFSFFLAKVAATVAVESGSGSVEMAMDFGIFDLIGGNAVPKRFRLSADAFPLDGAAAFALAAAANSPGANPMVAPLLAAIGVTAQLNGTADFKLDGKAPAQSTGEANLTLSNAVLKLDHPSLGLPNQVFHKAQIKAKVEGGKVVLDKTSGFVAEELELLTDGTVKLEPNALASQLNLKIVIRLNKGLKERFGFVIDAVTGNAASDGQLTMQLRGPMSNPVVVN